MTAILRRAILPALIVLAACCDAACAREVGFDLKLEKQKMQPGRQVYCFMTLPDGIPAPETPFVKDLNITYLKSRKQSARNAQPGFTVHVYRVIGRRPGIFTIGPIVFNHGSDTYRSNPLTLEIEESIPEAEKVAPVPAADDNVLHGYLTLEPAKTDAYVNERVPLVLSYYSDRSCIGDVMRCVIKSDDLIIEDARGSEKKTVERRGIIYNLTRRFCAFTAHTAGRFMIQPVTLEVDILSPKKDSLLNYIDKGADFQNDLASIRRLPDTDTGASFYDQIVTPESKKTIVLSTEPVYVTVRPLPKEGKPEDFTGAIGDFSFEFSASASETSLGGEITLTMTIGGPGNYNTVSAPRVTKARGISMYEAQAIKGEDSAVYEQVICVRSADVKEIPEAVFTFFNPATKKYVSVRKGPLPLNITGLGAQGAQGAQAQGTQRKPAAGEKKDEWAVGLKQAEYPLPQRRSSFHRNKDFLLFETLPLIFVLAGICLRMTADYLKRHPLYAASLSASRRARRQIEKAETMMAGGNAKEFHEFIFRALQAYLGTRRLRPADGVAGDIADQIDTSGLEKDVADSIKEIFHRCHIARYTRESVGKDDMAQILEKLKYVVNNLNRKAEI
jgi:hypothetical protein